MYIVTGGAGFIGSALAWKLNRMGIEDILLVDNLGETDKWKNLRALKFIDYLEKDEFRNRVLSGGMRTEITAILHLGACSATTETDASYLIDNNFNYTKELAEFAISNNIRFIYASSAATYGDGELGYEDDENKLETLRPMNMYGYSKQIFDLWAKRRGILDKITGCKFTNVYGPNEHHKGGMRSVVCKSFAQVRDEGKMKLFKSHKPEYADGEQKRDFLYVKDAVEMVIFLMERKLTGIYNVGSGRAETWNSLANAIFAAMDKEPNIEYIDMPEELRDRYQYYTCAEMDKLISCGYDKPATPLADAIKDYVQNYLLPDKFLGDEAPLV